jgi:hypothetical protein
MMTFGDMPLYTLPSTVTRRACLHASYEYSGDRGRLLSNVGWATISVAWLWKPFLSLSGVMNSVCLGENRAIYVVVKENGCACGMRAPASAIRRQSI